MMTLRLSMITACVLALSACWGTPPPSGDGDTGQTGDGDTDNEANSGLCGEETTTVLDDIDQVPAGFDTTPNELFLAAAGDFTGTFTWYPSDGEWTVTHAGTESPMSVSLSYQGGEARLIEVEFVGQYPDDIMAEYACANRLAAEFVLTLDTDDGVFAESMVVTVTMQGADAEAANPSISESLDLDAIMGSLSADDFIIGMGTLSDLILSVSFAEAAAYGSLGMEVTIGEGPDGAVGFGQIAVLEATRD